MLLAALCTLLCALLLCTSLAQQAGKWLRTVTKTGKHAVNAVMVHTAAVYFQRFYATRSFRRWDRWYTSAACLLLASKVEECQCSIALVLRAVNSVRTGLSQAETLAETALEVGGAPDDAAAAAAAAAAAPRRHEVPSELYLRSVLLVTLAALHWCDAMCRSCY
jgi:Cyclin, N-terminal domain